TDTAVLSVEPPANDFSISLERTQRPTERKHAHECANRERGVFPPICPQDNKIRLRLRRAYVRSYGCMYTHTCDEPKNDVTISASANLHHHAQKAKMAQRAFLFSLPCCFEEKKSTDGGCR